jgi:TonB family protein
MSVDVVRADEALCRRNERWTVASSIAVHALFLLLLVRIPAGLREGERLTEVSLLEPGVPAEPASAAPVAPAAPAPQTQSGVLRPKEEVRFRREAERDAAPDRQSDSAFEDRLNDRLATLQRDATIPQVGLATVVPPTAPRLVSAAALPSAMGAERGSPLELRRAAKGGGATAPLELARGGGGRGSAPNLALAALPAEKPSARATAPPPRALARQSLSGVSLAGPIADRPVLSAARPDYPDWAKAEAVEGSVTLYFIVRPDGTVKEIVMIQKTAGFQDFDDNASDALRAWRFAPLAPGRTGDQWGTITFHFRLAEAR